MNFIGLFGLALNLSISVAQMAAAMLLLWWAWRVYQNKDGVRWRATELDVPILAFIAWALFTAVIRQSTGFRDALSSQSAFLLFFWASQAIDGSDTRRLLHWIGVGAVLAGLIGIVQVLSQINFKPVEKIYTTPDFFQGWPRWLVHEMATVNDRAVGPRNHPLTYAESFIPGFFLLLGRLVRELKEARPSLRVIGFVSGGLAIIAGGVLVAQGRAVWLGLGAGLLVFSWGVGRKFFLKTIFFGSLALAIIVAVSPRIRGRLLSVTMISAGTEGDQHSKSMRYDLWREVAVGIRAYPIVGVGLEGARLNTMDPVMKEMRVWTETHNMFLQFMLELGGIGMGLFLWILIVIGRMIWRAPPAWRPAFAGMFVAFLAAGMTESWPKDKEIGMLFWTMIGSLAFFSREKI